jgi:hypothetical protein
MDKYLGQIRQFQIGTQHSPELTTSEKQIIAMVLAVREDLRVRANGQADSESAHMCSILDDAFADLFASSDKFDVYHNQWLDALSIHIGSEGLPEQWRVSLFRYYVQSQARKRSAGNKKE